MTPKPRTRRETSAGGVIFRRDGAQTLVLLIRDRHRNWGFPKGHVESGEEPDEAAVREVGEETGLTRVEVVGLVSTIEWEFRFRGRPIHKTCHFFAMTTEETRARPQRGEGITACKWVTVEQGERLITHANARAVLAAARELMASRGEGVESRGKGTASRGAVAELSTAAG